MKKSTLPFKEHKGLLITTCLSVVGLVSGFWPTIHKMSIRWNSGDNDYCFLIIPLFLYLCWEKREEFDFSNISGSFWGGITAILSVLLIYLGEFGSVETLLYTGIWGCLVSIILSMYGKRTWSLFFPILILLFIIPLPPFINKLITFKLKLLASSISADMLRAVGVSVLLEGNVLDLGVEKLQVVDACSGLRYLMSLILMALLIGYYFAKNWWGKITTLLLVIPLLLLLNATRIFSTGLLTINGYSELAEGSFHDTMGLVYFLVAGVLFYFAAKLLNKLPQSSPKPKQKRKIFTNNPPGKKPLYATIWLILLFTVSGYAFQNLSTEPTHPPRTEFNEGFPMQIGDWQGKRSYLSEEILESLWADDYLNATYFNKQTRNTIHLLIPFYEYQGTRHTAHAPQACLLGGGYAIEKSAKRSIKMNPDKSVEIMTMHMKKGETQVLANYFFLQRGRVITSPWVNKYYLMVDAILKNRTDGALVRIELIVPPNQNLDQAYEIQDNFIKQLWPLLSRYIPE